MAPGVSAAAAAARSPESSERRPSADGAARPRHGFDGAGSARCSGASARQLCSRLRASRAAGCSSRRRPSALRLGIFASSSSSPRSAWSARLFPHPAAARAGRLAVAVRDEVGGDRDRDGAGGRSAAGAPARRRFRGVGERFLVAAVAARVELRSAVALPLIAALKLAALEPLRWTMYPIHSGESYDELPRDGAAGAACRQQLAHEQQVDRGDKACLAAAPVGRAPDGAGGARADARRSRRLGLEPPSVISVTGAAAAEGESEAGEIFRRGLRKAAAITRAWIITGGTKSGVMELVGKTVREADTQVTCIGIAPAGAVQGHEAIFSKKVGKVCAYDRARLEPGFSSAGSARLDPNHSHFVLYHDHGLKGNAAFFSEIELRAAIEDTLSNHGEEAHPAIDPRLAAAAGAAAGGGGRASPGAEMRRRALPMVLLVLGGGEGTLQVVEASRASAPSSCSPRAAAPPRRSSASSAASPAVGRRRGQPRLRRAGGLRRDALQSGEGAERPSRRR